MRARTLIALGALAVSAACSEPASPAPPDLPGEVCVPGDAAGEYGFNGPASLQGWALRGPGVSANIIAAENGCRALRLTTGDAEPGTGRWLTRSIDASPLRGQRVQLTAWGRVGGKSASLWLRARDADGRIVEGALQDLKGDAWREHTLSFEVPRTVATLELALGLGRAEYVELGSLSLTRVQAGCLGCTPARPLARADNLVAFTRLLGHVRYFNPSDAAARTDWDTLAMAGIEAVEAAGTPAALADALARVFLPVAPGLRVELSPGTPAAELAAESATESTPTLVWVHRGAPNGGTWRMHDRRLWASLQGYPGVAPGDPGPHPDRPLRIELGGGVVASVPLAVRVPEDPAPGSPRVQLQRPAGFVAQAGDRTVRLAIVALAAAAFEHFSLRADRQALRDGAVLRRTLIAAAGADDRFAVRALLWRMFSDLGETSAQVHIDSDVELGWRPQLNWTWLDGAMVVTKVDEQNPGSCVRKGDVVEAIDGESMADGLARTVGLNRRASEDHTMLSATSVWARGRARDDLAFTVRHIDGAQETCEVRRGDVGTPGHSTPSGAAELASGVVYVNPGRTRLADLEAAEATIARARGVVVDLRNGVAPRNRQVLARWFGDLGHPRIPTLIRPGVVAYESIEPGPRAGSLTPGGPIVVLIDWSTQGDEEGIADALRHHHGAVLVGTTTSGWAGESLGQVKLPAGFTVGWVDRDFAFVSGAPGLAAIEPDIVARPTRESLAAGRDAVLERGIEVITRPVAWALRGPA